MFTKYKINKAYISPIDKALAEFDRTHPRSLAQQAEIKKYERIYRLRDHPIQEIEKSDIWGSK